MNFARFCQIATSLQYHSLFGVSLGPFPPGMSSLFPSCFFHFPIRVFRKTHPGFLKFLCVLCVFPQHVLCISGTQKNFPHPGFSKNPSGFFGFHWVFEILCVVGVAVFLQFLQRLLQGLATYICGADVFRMSM